MALRIIHGSKMPKSSDDFKYVKGFVTDTRLMGVLGLMLCYEQSLEEADPCLSYFFLYFDIEELGLEKFAIFNDLDSNMLSEAVKGFFGGLGAKYIPVTEKEGLYLAKEFVAKTKMLKKKLPDIGTLPFILEKESDLKEEEIKALNEKMCCFLNDYGLVNYYLMRCIGRDQKGAELISFNETDTKFLNLSSHGTFLKNEIWKKNDEYYSKSLVEIKNEYQIIRTKIKIKDNLVFDAKLLSRFKISDTEAALILLKAEFVNLYEVLIPMQYFKMVFSKYSLGFDRTRHLSGDMYISFNDNNDHALRRVFNLSDDIKAIYFLTDSGQLLVGASTKKDIETIEKEIEKGELNQYIDLDGRFEFDQSIIYEFALSGLSDFNSFLSEE